MLYLWSNEYVQEGVEGECNLLLILPTTEGLEEAVGQLQQVVPKYAALIVDRVSRQCIHCLEAAQTIPRLYRRTNREVRYILIANCLSYCKISHTA